MGSVNTVVFAFVWIFTAVLLFVILNTIFVGKVIPIMGLVAENTSFVDQDRYDTVEAQATSIFYTVFFIMIALPFIWFAVKMLLSREPAPTGGGFVNAIRV